MAYKYIFGPIAADEYEEAFKWYEEKSIVAADGLDYRCSGSHFCSMCQSGQIPQYVQKFTGGNAKKVSI